MLTSPIARELTLDAAQSARGARTSNKSLPAAQITKLLDSRNEREVLEGLRKVISVRFSDISGRLLDSGDDTFEFVQNGEYATNAIDLDDVPLPALSHVLLLCCEECGFS